jgi:hypothetical protein
VDGEISSILTSPLGFLPSFDHLIRSHQHIRRNRQADLLGGFEVYYQLKLRGLLDGKIGGL